MTRLRWSLMVGLLTAHLLCAGALEAQLPEHPALSAEVSASWVDEAEIDLTTPRPADGDLDVTYLLVDSQIRLPRRGPDAIYRRYAYRIETRAALEEWASWDIEFDPSYQQLRMHHLRVYRDGAWHDRLASSRASLLHRESDLDRQIFDQRFNLVLIFDDIRPGDVVSIAFTMVGQNPVFGGRYTGSESLAWGRAIQRHRLRVLSATQRPMQFKVFGDGAEPVVSSEKGLRTWTWDAAEVAERDYVFSVPVDHVQYPFVQLSEFASWNDVVQWALPLYATAQRQAVPEALRQVAADIESVHPSPEARLVAARDWVQENIRYFGVMLGEHSHAPHQSAEILRRHYGDCKDKTLLLIELLGLLQIEAHPAFVHSSLTRGIKDRLPSPTVFDHVIVVAQLAERQVWMDPTLSFQGGHLDDAELWVPDYGLALPVVDGTEALQALPDTQTDTGRTQVTYTYDLKAEGEPWQVRIETVFERRQAEEIRTLLETTSKEDLLEGYIEHYETDTLTLESLQPLEIVDRRLENQLTITELYRVAYDSVDDEDGTILDTLPLLLSGDLTQPEVEDERQAPYALSKYPVRKERVILHLPADFELAQVQLTEENPWFSFSVSSEALSADQAGEGRVGLELLYKLETRAEQVAVADIETYSKSVQTVWDNMGYSIWNAGLSGVALRRFTVLNTVVAFAAVLCLGVACLTFLARWRLI